MKKQFSLIFGAQIGSESGEWAKRLQNFGYVGGIRIPTCSLSFFPCSHKIPPCSLIIKLPPDLGNNFFLKIVH